MRRVAIVTLLFLFGLAFTLVSREPRADERLGGARRAPARNGWIFVRLEGAPARIGFQHGYLLAAEIADTLKAVSTEMRHDENKDWQYFRTAAEKVLWPRVDAEYREELQGIVEGATRRGVKVDLWDIVALNGALELPYYKKWSEKQAKPSAAEHCSAFAATGSYTRDGRVVIGHNNWTGYASGERWNIIFDIRPEKGHRILMDGMAGLIHSADDFGMNSAGIIITETTISKFNGFDPAGIPEFVRARKAMQYAASIDDFARLMTEGNNGGYANDWLVADRKNNEIASLELGLKNVTLERTRDGFFVGANFPIDPKLAREETPDYPADDKSYGNNTRRVRWLQLMDQYKGKIDVAAGQRFLADHLDTFQNKVAPSERTLCGHLELSPRGSPDWQPPFGTAGTVQSKVASGAMAERMSLTAALGHACGIHFKAAAHLKKHPDLAWEKDILKDMPSRPWTTFTAP
jgi:hypothetical protein